MLGLGSSLISGSAPSSLTPLALQTTATTATNDENVQVIFTVFDGPTRAAITKNKTLGTGKRMNGTAALTATNITADPEIVGSDVFNVFQFINGNTVFFFLSLDTNDITINNAASYLTVDLTDSGFVDGSGDVDLDASGSGERYNFSLTLSIDGFKASEPVTSSNISIDAA